MSEDLALARSGDSAAFSRLVAPLRPELHAYCYRVLGSSHDADDALQDGLLRAWRGIARFEGRSSLRAWLYTVVTRTCLDTVRGRRVLPMDLDDDAEVAWLGPYPTSPSDSYEQRESVELAFVAALQHLPPNQRAALVLFEVLGFSAAEIASVMDTSTTSVNSAIARARKVIAAKVPSVSQQQTLRKIDDARLREVVSGYASALERGDASALMALLASDVTWSMPPLPEWYSGLDAAMDFAVRVPLTSCGAWRHRFVSANGQPAVAAYLRRDGAEEYLAWSINVLTLRDDRICEITSFIGEEHFTLLGLPGAL
ncbi:ECF RNA polymerase sigma factor SigG [Lentzea sp. NBRC 105346]|uniref:RNA polymerase subunit sigma-70 n=1 Tax=Lentzea sp. NBRC 105346 TaxID=3032205 RepID=UPI0024A0D960|nr:RNA polymerase subunit sigma-70 [Lentzea sp. NBRC 105346]GLZ29185.1 ECF RNA polymerase sigma factor SigG [Lentzea sp. NBRC 105346]